MASSLALETWSQHLLWSASPARSLRGPGCHCVALPTAFQSVSLATRSPQPRWPFWPPSSSSVISDVSPLLRKVHVASVSNPDSHLSTPQETEARLWGNDLSRASWLLEGRARPRVQVSASWPGLLFPRLRQPGTGCVCSQRAFLARSLPTLDVPGGWNPVSLRCGAKQARNRGAMRKTRGGGTQSLTPPAWGTIPAQVLETDLFLAVPTAETYCKLECSAP